MTNVSGRKFIARSRPSRVVLNYDVPGTNRTVTLPFVMGVLSDLSGDSVSALPDVADRTAVSIDADNFDMVLKAQTPRVQFTVPNLLSDAGGDLPVDVTFESMDDFSPARVASKLEPLRQLMNQLENLKSGLDVNCKAGASVEGQLMGQSTLAMVAEIDRRLSRQMNAILHHDKFRKLEGTWRGLHHLVTHTETDTELQIRVLNLSKNAFADTLRRYSGAKWDRSPIFDKFYNEPYRMFDGLPYGTLIGDYEFDYTPRDVAALSDIAKVAAAAHAPFIAAAAPNLFMLDSWRELDGPHELKAILERSADHAGWRALRDSDDAKYLGLCMPRFLARLPYAPKTNPAEGFAFEEVTESGNYDNFVWSNSTYLMATNIARSFKSYGWCARIEGLEAGGSVSGLPTYTFPTEDGGRAITGPTEIAINMRRSAELADCGLLALEHMRNSDVAVFFVSSSVHKPKVYDDVASTASARLSARLAHLFAASRFTHFIEKMMYYQLGAYKSRQEMEDWLNQWLTQYTLDSPERFTDDLKASPPLQSAKVKVQDIEGNPGFYSASILLVPHEMADVPIAMSLVAKLPKPKSCGGSDDNDASN